MVPVAEFDWVVGKPTRARGRRKRQPMSLDAYRAAHADIIAYRRANPCLTLEAVAQRFGVTRERVRQVLKKAGEPTAHFDSRPVFLCLQCEKPLTRHGSNRKFCSRACYSAYYRVPVVCDNCGATFRRLASQVINYNNKLQRWAFCGKQCQGKFIAKRFGLGVPGQGRDTNAYKEWAAKRHASIEARREIVWAEHLRTGEGRRRLARRLGIGSSTVGYYLTRMRKKLRAGAA